MKTKYSNLKQNVMKDEINENKALSQTSVSDSYVWAFIYCPCIHESSFTTVSLHKTEKGAEIAMEFHKENERKEHEEMYANLSINEKSELYVEFGTMEAWDVQKFPVLE